MRSRSWRLRRRRAGRSAGDPDVMIAGLPEPARARAPRSTRSSTTRSSRRSRACRPQSGATPRSFRVLSSARCAVRSTPSGARNRRCMRWWSRYEPAQPIMIGRLNHVAIAVPDLEKAARTYRETLGAHVSAALALPEHGVTVVFVELPNTKIELLQPLGEKSPIAKFLERNPDGGMHHLCYEVEDIIAARDDRSQRGACARRREAEDRRPRQAGAVPASERLRRRADRDRAGVRGCGIPPLRAA